MPCFKATKSHIRTLIITFHLRAQYNNNYVVEKRSCSWVWILWHRLPGRSRPLFFRLVLVAVKSADIDHSDSLRREEEFLYSLRGNPSFVHCYGTDTSLEDDGEPVYNLLLEYAAGGSLQSLIKSCQGEIPEGEVAFYSYQLLVGLSDLHALGIVHCDLKPHKIETQEPKIPVFCKDFLKKCLNRNCYGRWSAKRLMTHPFFLRNLAPVIYWTKVVDCDYELPENPFGYDNHWVNNKDLFSNFNRYSHYDCMDDEKEYAKAI